MKENKGFTLIELMIVVAIIAIIAAIAIPNLLESRKAANEGSAISSLRTISSSQGIYHETGKSMTLNGTATAEYGTLADLAAAELVDANLGAGQKSGYAFVATPDGGSPDVLYWATADPLTPGTTGERFFGVGVSGVIYQDSAAIVADPGAAGTPVN